MIRRSLLALVPLAILLLPGLLLPGPVQAEGIKKPQLTAAPADCPAGARRDQACVDANKGDTRTCPCVVAAIGDAPAAAGSLDADGAQGSKWAPTGALAPVKTPLPVAPLASGARKVRSGTIKLVCPAGTDKLCDGNNCGCWTRND